MDDWQEMALGDFVSLQRGHDLPDKDRSPGTVPVMGSFGVTGWHNQARTKGPGVTVGRSGASIGVVSFIACDYWPLNTCLFATDFHGNSPRFVYFLLKTLDLAGLNSGSAQPSLNRNYIHPIPIRVPGRSEQDRIVDLLGAIDDTIELHRRMNETLEALARALFKDWFVDFGPTHAKQEGCEPYLAPELWSLFPERLDVEGKPEGWRQCQLQDIADVNPAEPLKKGTIAPYLDMGALPTRGPISEPAVSREFTSGMRFRNGDTLLARITPCLENGKTAFVQTLPDGSIGWGSTEFIVMRAKPAVPAAYTYLLARDSGFRTHAIQSMTGTSGRQRVRNEAVTTYPCVTFDTAIWSAFGAIIEPLFERIRENGEESRTLARTRDLLLPKLMSGEICIRDAASTIEALVP